jgi:hypothetical protein
MSTVLPFQGGGAFDQNAISAMSTVLEDVCTTMNLRTGAKNEREAIAIRIVELALQGETDPERLRARMLRGWQSPQHDAADIVRA